MGRGIVSERRTLWYFEEGPVPRLTSLEAAEEFSVQMQLKICSFCECDSQRADTDRAGAEQATRDSSTNLHGKMSHGNAEIMCVATRLWNTRLCSHPASSEREVDKVNK